MLSHKFLVKLTTQIYNFSENENTESLQPPTVPPTLKEEQTNSQFKIILKTVLDNSFICKSSYFMEDFSASLISISLANIVRLQNSKKYQFEIIVLLFGLSFRKIQNNYWNGTIKLSRG